MKIKITDEVADELMDGVPDEEVGDYTIVEIGSWVFEDESNSRMDIVFMYEGSYYELVRWMKNDGDEQLIDNYFDKNGFSCEQVERVESLTYTWRAVDENQHD